MKIKLQEILDDRNISIYSLSKDIGVAQNNLGKLIKGETTSIKYDILEKLCNILNVTPNDIFEIEPQLTLFNDINQNLLSEKTLQLVKKLQKPKDSDDISLILDNEILDLEYMQERFEMEYNLSKNIFLITDYIIDNADTSEFHGSLTSDIEKYKSMKNSIEASKFMFVYRMLCIIVISQLNDIDLFNFIKSIKDIYSSNPFFSTINDDKLNELLNKSNIILEQLNNKSITKD